MEKNKVKRPHIGLLVATLVMGALGIGLSLPHLASAADKYPTKPISIIVPYAAGGMTDLAARIWAQHLPKYLKQPVVVENVPGAGAVAGAMQVKNARPDGYVIGQFGGAFILAKYMLPVAPDMKDFEVVAQQLRDYRIFAASEKSGFKNLKDVAAFGKKSPGDMLVGVNPGAGSQLDTVTMIKALNIDVNYVPYKSGADRNVALAGGHVQVSADSMSALKSYVDAKKVTLLGIAAPNRIEAFKDIPTFNEQGFEAGDVSTWEGIFVPKGTPPDVIKTLESAIQQAARDEAVIEQFKKFFQKPMYLPGTEFRKVLADEDVRVKALVQELKLAPQK